MPRRPSASRSRSLNGKTGEAAQGVVRAGNPERAGLAQAPISRSLSATDAAFIYLERQEIPLHIASVSIFDGPIPFDQFVGSIESKLSQVPRYQQIVVAPPFNLGLPTWENDPHFDIHRHIFRVTVDPPGGEAELEDLAGRILSRVMDRSKPLWDIHLIDGLKDGRGAMIWRIHHSLADGIAGMGIVQMFLDATPEISRATRKRRLRLPPPQPAAKAQALTDGIGSVVHGALEGLVAAEKGLMRFGQALLSDRGQKGLKDLVGLLPELAASVERLPFNKPCGGERKFCWMHVDFADVQAVHKATGAKVNDIVLTVLTQALARYVTLHGESIENRFVRIVCPVSLRNGDDHGELGNQISFLPVALPLDVRSPIRMLNVVAERTSTMKDAGAAGVVALAASWIAAAPPPLQALFWWGLPGVILPVPLFNMICTNVPGSPVPLYAAGKRMLASYPQVPTGYDLGIGCAVQSYDGKLCFGLIADAHVAADVGRLRDFLGVAFEELCRSAGVKSASNPRLSKPARSKNARPPRSETRAARTRPSKLAGPRPVATPAAARAVPPATGSHRVDAAARAGAAKLGESKRTVDI